MGSGEAWGVGVSDSGLSGGDAIGSGIGDSVVLLISNCASGFEESS